MEIIEYEDKYLEDVRDLLTELEEYIVSIDEDELDHVHPEYHEKMALLDLEEVQKNLNGSNQQLYDKIVEIEKLKEEFKQKQHIIDEKTLITENINGKSDAEQQLIQMISEKYEVIKYKKMAVLQDIQKIFKKNIEQYEEMVEAKGY